MPDATYRDRNFVLQSKGVAARRVDDTYEPGFWLNEDNCEELAENAIANRLGTSIVNRTQNSIQPLAGGEIHSLAKLASINGQSWRYAGAGTQLGRRTTAGQGAYDVIATAMSGQPWQSQTYGSTEFTSLPYIFIADLNGMLKDNGLLAAPQQMGIFQPQYPMSAQAQAPVVIPLDPNTGNGYGATGISGLATNVVTYPSTTITNPVVTPGLQFVQVSTTPNPMGLFQYVTVGAERVLVVRVTQVGFWANFTAAHPAGTVVQGHGYTGGVSSTGYVSCSFAGKPIAAFPGTLQLQDYISMQLFISDPTDIQQIIIKFDCGDGSFNSDYFYKVIGQGPLQDLLNTAAQPNASATDALVADAIGVYGNSQGGLGELNVGQNSTTAALFQLSDFAGSGRADFSDPVYNWQNVGGYQITFVTNNNAGETVSFMVSSVVLFGGAGPDALGGVGYDYLFTLYNANDNTESNPCMVMSDVAPPLNTNRVYPRRQPVLVKMNLNNFSPTGQLQDLQVTHVRPYRRGGILGDTYRRLDTVPINNAAGGIVSYIDTAADQDIAANAEISFTNDVPVTSSLPVPVATTLKVALSPGTAGAQLTVTPVSMANISVRQQVSLGVLGALANTFETVIVLSVAGTTFQAFVQNPHAAGEPVSATAKYGQALNIFTIAFGQSYMAGDKSNPHYLYYSPRNSPQYVSSAAYVAVGSPDDPITAIVQFKGNVYVSTVKYWWSIAPGTGGSSAPTVYPTAAKHGCVAPNGFIVTEEAIFYQAIDGIRAFAGGASSYLTQDQEFIWQGIGSSPIVKVDRAQISRVQAAYWNMMQFFSYLGTDGNWHRMIYHQVYKRWRNDDVIASAMLLEADTNTLVFGDPLGVVHIDRQEQAYDEAENSNSQLVLNPIQISLQSPFDDQGEPAITKSYQELTFDVNTNGMTLQVFLVFNDGEVIVFAGTLNTTERQKVNLALNKGFGYEYYKASVWVIGSVTKFIYIYQGALKSLPLAKTRTSFDTFWMKLGVDESKIAKNVFIEYTSTQPVDFAVYYDGAAVPGFIFTLQSTAGFRKVIRTRLPGITFRLIRFVALSPQNFQVWEGSKLDWKTVGTGKGWQSSEMVPNG